MCFNLNISSILVQALLEAIGSGGSSGQEAVANAEISAAILTAKAGARDPSAIPSICRVSAALQYSAGEYIIIFHALKGYDFFSCKREVSVNFFSLRIKNIIGYFLGMY
jgi:hypothetical protein